MTTRKSMLNTTPCSFQEYQKLVDSTDESKKVLVSLLGLVGEIGDLHSIFKKFYIQRDSPTFADELSEEIGDVLWYLTSLASRHKLSLEKIAQRNIEKAQKFSSEGDNASYDSGFGQDEQLPRSFEVVFGEKNIDQATRVTLQVNGVFVGDSLTDNSHGEDGYRYHDVFHLAYAAVLGWSPVTRAILKRKRKSDARIDEVEDGARAIIVEEAISIYIFNQAINRDRYTELSSVDIGLLKTVMRLCANLEVKNRTAKQWQKAIFKGYSVFRELTANKGGLIRVDLDAADITYTPTHLTAIAGKANVRRKGNNLPRGLASRDL